MIFRHTAFIFMLFGLLATARAQQVLDVLDEPLFKEGEELVYDVSWGVIKAGEASLKVLATDVKFNDRPVFHINGYGKTTGMVDLFAGIRDRYDTYIDRKTFLPYLYTEDIKEGSYKRKTEARFSQLEKKVVAGANTFKTGEQTFDLISAYFFARSLNLKEFSKGQKFILRYFLNDAILPLEIQYVGKEVIETSFGKFNCLKFSPAVRPGKLLKKDSKLYLWVSDDANRVPIRGELELVLGSIKVELKTAKGLKHPIVTLK